MVIIHLLRRGEGLRIYFPLISDRIESTWALILYSQKCRTGIQNQIRNTTWGGILIYQRVSTLILFILFDCNCILIIYSYIHYYTLASISQTSSTRITCWTHWFHQILRKNSTEVCFGNKMETKSGEGFLLTTKFYKSANYSDLLVLEKWKLEWKAYLKPEGLYIKKQENMTKKITT